MSEKRYELEMVLRHEGGGDMFKVQYLHLDMCDALYLESVISKALRSSINVQAKEVGCPEIPE